MLSPRPGEPVAAIVGPTAVGKSEIALEVAARLQAEIISVDSMQVYIGMDIGTAKLPPEKRVSRDGTPIPHHLLDLVTPDQPFSVSQYQALARQAILDIRKRGKLPLLVGGTGLYFQAVIDPYRFQTRDESLRRRLEAEAADYGPEHLWNKLKDLDPRAAQRIHPHDRRRLIRALEVYFLSGQPISATWHGRYQSPYRLALAGLTMERPVLYRRIEKRVESMLKTGLVEEVRRLLEKYGPGATSMQALGYKEIAAYLRGELTLDAAVELLKRNTRRFAKRQLTWFKRDPRIRWWEIKEYQPVEEISAEIAGWISRTIDISVE
ncbi:MAG: tRNA dimethylallyltransferase [Clostridia bacterium]|nr:tRNA dimethylallyltransferase [Clostridia bacterium]